jgi:energy-coupling factor transporter ATP-binding protein EcfA2
MPERSPHHIAKISLLNLFGRYSYALPRGGENLTDLNILYGENGLGKTTLLSLVFHLLSPLRTRNHVALISSIPFQSLLVTLNDGTTITAEKDVQLLAGPVKFGIDAGQTGDIGPGKVEWVYLPNSSSTLRFEDLPESINIDLLPNEMKSEVSQALAQRQYFSALSKLQVTTFMLTSDRILLGDTVDVLERDRRPRPEPPPARSRLSELVIEHRMAAVTQALASASNWLQKKFVDRSYGAAESASKVYEKVVSRIATTPYKTSEGLSAAQQMKLKDGLTSRIEALNDRSKEFGKFGLAQLSISLSALETVRRSTGNKLNLIEKVLGPHVDELEARLENIEPFYLLVRDFVSNVNKFFRDKQITYSVRLGLRIFSDQLGKSQEITPSQLSSGEQQLVLIFCNVLTASDAPSIFIIDEPEISLNILWQRMLVTSLQELSAASQTQFLFASHSMEILAKHRNRVITLEDA